jgi:hemerythrin-like metal-binding protein
MGNFIEWNEYYSVGNETIDSQHKRLIEILNNFHVNFKINMEAKYISKTIDELEEYIEYHFITEEELMEKSGYKYFDEHKKEHDSLKKMIIQIKTDYSEGKKSINFELMEILKNWLVRHIIDTDKKMTGKI